MRLLIYLALIAFIASKAMEIWKALGKPAVNNPNQWNVLRPNDDKKQGDEK